ncbi:uncharacterized protein LOC142169064 [Nicotiana tabacum]|uniref:Uncharacterized protein LOC142169064 n=1 Tax=Nicotiana tabacum TaxID=4097 RepID=A0AC58SN12_TOBAC
METYAKSYDIKVWHFIKKGNLPLPQAKNDKIIESQVNAKAKNLLYNSKSGEKYEKISSSETAKEMWDKLEVAHEGTNKVIDTRINLLIHDYELFQMKDEESVEEMFSRFSKLLEI